jgi:hypothetical protein
VTTREGNVQTAHRVGRHERVGDAPSRICSPRSLSLHPQSYPGVTRPLSHRGHRWCHYHPLLCVKEVMAVRNKHWH